MIKYQLHFKINIGADKVPATVVMPAYTMKEVNMKMRIVKRALLKWPYDFALHDEAGILIRKL